MTRERLTGLLSGFMPVQLAYVMARLELADRLNGSSLTVDELGAETGTRPDLMRRPVRGLAGVGLVRLEAGDRVSLTEMGALLAASSSTPSERASRVSRRRTASRSSTT
jgi:hypothetical protein